MNGYAVEMFSSGFEPGSSGLTGLYTTDGGVCSAIARVFIAEDVTPGAGPVLISLPAPVHPDLIGCHIGHAMIVQDGGAPYPANVLALPDQFGMLITAVGGFLLAEDWVVALTSFTMTANYRTAS